MKNYDIQHDELQTEIHLADIQRSLGAIAHSWENDTDLSTEEMTNQLEAMCIVLDGGLDYNQFIEKLEIKDIKDS